MKRGFSATYRYPQEYDMTKTAKLTNSMNSTYLKSFNQWGGVSYADILSNYPEEMINACWDNLSRSILENYQSGKGTMIKGFGTFTFTNVEYSLEGTNNQYYRDIKRRKPVFIVSTEFVEYLKPGMYTKKGGLLYYTQKINNSVPIVKVNYSKISYGINISKEECYTIISTTFKLMGDQIRRGEYIPKYMQDLGMLLLRGHIYGMKFDDYLFENLSQKTQKLIHTKKNLRLYMETKDSKGIRHRNIEDIDKAERDIRPKKAVITSITKSADNWLQKNMGIDVKKDIKDEPRDDLYLNKPLIKNEFYVDQRDYRKYPLQNLRGLNIPQNILEGIYNSKYLLIRNMKRIDRHGDGLIPKYDFINCFRDTNCHHLLRTELIEKITDAYINNDPDIIMIHYNHLINALCEDIKNIINNEYNNFPIEKYKYTIPKNNKRAQSAYAFNKESGNLTNEAISSLQTYNNINNINENEIYDEMDKIDRLAEFIEKENKSRKMISYLALIAILRKHKLNIDKIKMIKILKFLNISNPNAFYLNEVLNKINKYFINKRNNKQNIRNKRKKRNRNTMSNGYIKKDNINYEDKDNNFVINAIQIIKNRIFEKNGEVDNINKYFEHLLSYNICRKENIIFPQEFERLLQLEEYDFTSEEIYILFNYIDTKKDGYIDRLEFINAFKEIPYPLTVLKDFIIKNNLSVGDIAYKVGIDLYNINSYDEISKNLIDRLDFRAKLKSLNEEFEPGFIDTLFNMIGPKGLTKVITVDEFLNFFNILPQKEQQEYKYLHKIKDKSIELCQKIIPQCVSLNEIKKECQKYDPNITGKISVFDFFDVLHYYINDKIDDKDIIYTLRAYGYIDNNDNVKYNKFLMMVFIEHIDDKFDLCLNLFKKFLNEECCDDLFIFIAKINNIPNDSNLNRVVNRQRLYEFFRQRIDMLEFNTINKFDYNNDGIIDMNDLKNVIINYIDKNFFYSNNNKINENIDYNFEENKNIYINIRGALDKLNMTDNNLFYYLDNNKDNFIDFNEFRNQINKLPLVVKLTQKQLNLFFSYLDEFNNGKVDINSFQKKLGIIKEYINSHNEQGYKGNATMENLILSEFDKYCKKYYKLSDTELFSIIDSDLDGIISPKDMNNFCIKNLFLSPNELSDDIIIRFIEAISLTRSRNLTLADIQNLMKCFKKNDLDNIRFNIHNYCNESENINLNMDRKENKEWLEHVVDKIGDFISEKYDDNIKRFYDDYNVTDFRNKGQGLSFENFNEFIIKNYLLFEPYHIYNNENQKIALFNYLSNNKKFITLDNLNYIFGNDDDNEDNTNLYFYQKMHNDIISFLNDNFENPESAFKYFHNNIPLSNKNDYITKKEFFNSLSNLFPNKYATNTILTYYQKYFKDKPVITYGEFAYIYYNLYNDEYQYVNSLKNTSKIKTIRSETSNNNFTSYKSPFITEKNKKLITPYDSDPLEKIKRLILSARIDFKKACIDYIDYISGKNGLINQYQFLNFIKKLNLGLTNIEIEDIMNKSGMTYDGYINLEDFYKYITNKEINLECTEKHIIAILKQIKQYMYKYYKSPRLAFDSNDIYKKGFIDFERFKKLIYELYYKEKQKEINYPVVKAIYDFIDVRKDGVIDLNEWNKVFAITESNLDAIKGPESQYIREWEGSEEMAEVYKKISKNKKLIKEKVKLYNIKTSSNMLIQENNLIDILIHVLGRLRLSYPQWKMIVSIGNTNRSGIIDFNAFINAVDSYVNNWNSHPRNFVKK